MPQLTAFVRMSSEHCQVQDPMLPNESDPSAYNQHF